MPGRELSAFHKLFGAQNIIGIITSGADFDVKQGYSQEKRQKKGNIE
jgi:hypothetical protein